MTQEFKSKVLKESMTFTEGFEQEAFEEGVCFALHNIWHEPKEKPKAPSRVLASRGLMTETFDYVGTKHSVDTLKCYTRLCYLDDILPEKEPLYWDEEKGTIILEL